MDLDCFDVFVVVDKCIVLDFIDGQSISFQLLFLQEVGRPQVDILQCVNDLFVGFGVDNH